MHCFVGFACPLRTVHNAMICNWNIIGLSKTFYCCITADKKYNCPSEKDSHLLSLVYAFSRNDQESHYSSQWLFILSDGYKNREKNLWQLLTVVLRNPSWTTKLSKFQCSLRKCHSDFFFFSKQRSWFDLEKNTLCCSAASTLSLSVDWANCLLKEREWGVVGNSRPHPCIAGLLPVSSTLLASTPVTRRQGELRPLCFSPHLHLYAPFPFQTAGWN